MSNRALAFLNYYFRIFSKTANYLKKKKNHSFIQNEDSKQ